MVFLNADRFSNEFVFSAAGKYHGKMPTGMRYVFSQYPKGEQQQVIKAIQRFSPGSVSVRATQLLEFDLLKNEVRLCA